MIKIQPFLSKTVSLLTIESIIAQNLVEKLAKTSKSTILTTVEAYSHQKYADQLASLSNNSNIRVVPYYQPLVHHHYELGKVEFDNKEDPRGISLLVGNNNKQMVAQLNQSKIMTMEELCQAFPQKIPLSFRSKGSEDHIQALEKRIGAALSRKRVLQFQHIIMISPYVKMWDEAIQVIMDFMPTAFYIPYFKNSPKAEYYTLTVDDFLNALTKIQSTMKIVVKNHAGPNIIRYNQRKQLDWMISQVAPEAETMIIDHNFFTEHPKTMKEVEDDVHIPIELEKYL